MISRPYSSSSGSSSGSSNRSFGSTIPTSLDGSIDADFNNDYSDSSSVPSNSTRNSIRALYYEEHIEHGRRYSGRADQQYYQPADQAQMGSWSVGHLTLMVMDSQRENPWFHSPISEDAKRILDIGTGDGSWVKDVADRFPHVNVLGIDLSPPPAGFVPPNCSFETEDATKEWVWEERFDLIHLRWMLGSFTPDQWRDLYAQAYDRLQPGGWIEHVEPSVIYRSDDSSLPPTSLLSDWGQKFERMGATAGRPFDLFDTMRDSIEAAGFTNIQEKLYKVPIGTWARHPILKDAGRLNEEQFREGMEGYALYMLTHIGDPEPMTADEVKGYLAGVRSELKERHWHKYIFNRRVWAQKPLDAEARDKATPVVKSEEEKNQNTRKRAREFISQ